MTRRALSLVFFLFLAFDLSVVAQPFAPATNGQSSDSTNADGQSKPDERTAADSDPATFDERDAAEVLGIIRDGLEGHSQRRLLSAFDKDKMDGFLTFQDQIEAYFTRYEGFRVTLHILQTSEENNRSVILADFQIESEPRGGGRVSHREGRLRFELERGIKGWKIVDFTPRGFFS